MALRAASTSALAMSISSVPVPRPTFERFSRMRTRLGAALAIATISSILSAPWEPASTSDVTPCESTMPGMSVVRACACTSMRPGTTSLPIASNGLLRAFRGNAHADGGNASVRDRHVRNAIDATRRVDHSSAANQQVVRRREGAPAAGEPDTTPIAAVPHEITSSEHCSLVVNRWSLVVGDLTFAHDPALPDRGARGTGAS